MKKDTPTPETTSSRRGFFFGAAAAGAAVAATTTLPGLEASVADSPLPPAPENGGGYSLSEHVKRYYQTTRV